MRKSQGTYEKHCLTSMPACRDHPNLGCLDISRNFSKSLEISRNLSKSHEISRNLSNSEGLLKASAGKHPGDISQNLSKSLEISRNLLKSSLFQNLIVACNSLKSGPLGVVVWKTRYMFDFHDWFALF